MIGPLDRARLATLPDRLPAVRRVVVLEETGSTNDDARRLAAEGAPAWTVVISGCQSRGRGRLGRTWHSAAGLGLYVSVLLRPLRPAPEIARWTLAAAAAAAEACAAAGARAVAIKWPNDVLASGLKVAGILAEGRTSGSGTQDLVIGAGFNVFHEPGDFPEELRGRAASLRMAGASPGTTREGLAEDWLGRFGELAAYLDRGVWEPVAARWTARALEAEGAPVRIVAAGPGGDARAGITRGIDASGALRVETAPGEMVAVRIAESVVALEE